MLVFDPRGHVWYSGRVRPRHFRPHRKRHKTSAAEELLLVRRVHAHGRRAVGRADWFGCRLRHWNCRRRGTYRSSDERAKGIY